MRKSSSSSSAADTDACMFPFCLRTDSGKLKELNKVLLADQLRFYRSILDSDIYMYVYRPSSRPSSASVRVKVSHLAS